jgi:hypothetical protein
MTAYASLAEQTGSFEGRAARRCSPPRCLPRRDWHEDGLLGSSPYFLVVAAADDDSLGGLVDWRQNERPGAGVWEIGVLIVPEHRLNHALHLAAITQIRYPHSPGRHYYERKLAEGKTPREAIRALKRRPATSSGVTLSPTPSASAADQRARAGHSRNGSVACVTGSHLNTGSSAKSLPRP